MEEGRKKTVYDERQHIRPICNLQQRKPTTDLAYLDRAHSGYKLVFLLARHHISFLHIGELVKYIHVFLIVVLVCMS